MKRVITSASNIVPESFLSETVKKEYAEDLANYHPGSYDQEGIGWLARQYGFNLIEMLDVLETAIELDIVECIKPGVSYKIFPIE